MPTSYEPVKVRPSTPGCATSARPGSSPPWITWKAFAGRPASARHSASLCAEKAPCGLGFSTTVLPATSAPPAGPAASAIGKLNGLMTPHTPNGRSTLRVRSRVGELVHVDGEAVVALHLGAVVADQVRRLLHVTEGLEPVLPDLGAHQAGELVRPLADEVGRAAQHRDPLLPRHVAPRAGLLGGRAHGVVDVLRRGLVHPAEQDGGVVRAVHLDRRAVGAGLDRPRAPGGRRRTRTGRSSAPPRTRPAAPRCRRTTWRR